MTTQDDAVCCVSMRCNSGSHSSWKWNILSFSFYIRRFLEECEAFTLCRAKQRMFCTEKTIFPTFEQLPLVIWKFTVVYILCFLNRFCKLNILSFASSTIADTIKSINLFTTYGSGVTAELGFTPQPAQCLRPPHCLGRFYLHTGNCHTNLFKCYYANPVCLTDIQSWLLHIFLALHPVMKTLRWQGHFQISPQWEDFSLKKTHMT